MPSEKTINGYSFISYEDFVKISSKEKTITIAISDSSIRSRICNPITQDRINQISIIS